MNRSVAVIASAAAVFSWLGVELVRRWAARNLLDIPNERSSHSVPTPRGGGLAIAIVFLIGVVALQIRLQLFSMKQFAAYMVVCTLIVTVSWIDDLIGVANRWRFLAHIIAAVTLILAFGPLEIFQVGPVSLRNPFVGWILTAAWVVGLINAFNFMDGIDGIASLQAIIACAGWYLVGSSPTRWVALLLAACAVGFLLHNWPPARIFMGDVGSALLGFVIASLPLLENRSPQTFECIAFLAVWPFVFDTAFTLIRRWRKNENIFAAHRSHLYQRLVIQGMSHQTCTTLYGGLAALGVLLGLGVARRQISEPLAFLTVVLMAAGLWALTVSRERHSIDIEG